MEVMGFEARASDSRAAEVLGRLRRQAWGSFTESTGDSSALVALASSAVHPHCLFSLSSH